VNREEFEALLCDELRAKRPDFAPEEAQELAEATARVVPDTDSAREAFLVAYARAVFSGVAQPRE
jgi:hypothetical protein